VAVEQEERRVVVLRQQMRMDELQRERNRPSDIPVHDRSDASGM
jgi:hypothetical protein